MKRGLRSHPLTSPIQFSHSSLPYKLAHTNYCKSPSPHSVSTSLRHTAATQNTSHSPSLCHLNTSHPKLPHVRLCSRSQLRASPVCHFPTQRRATIRSDRCASAAIASTSCLLPQKNLPSIQPSTGPVASQGDPAKLPKSHPPIYFAISHRTTADKLTSTPVRRPTTASSTLHKARQIPQVRARWSCLRDSGFQCVCTCCRADAIAS